MVVHDYAPSHEQLPAGSSSVPLALVMVFQHRCLDVFSREPELLRLVQSVLRPPDCDWRVWHEHMFPIDADGISCPGLR